METKDIATGFSALSQETRLQLMRVLASRGASGMPAGELAATMMVRIQQGGVHDSTGLDDAEAYRELASILTRGIDA